MVTLGILSLLLTAPNARAGDCNATNAFRGPVLQWPVPCGLPDANNCTTIAISPKVPVPVWLDHCTGANFAGYGTADGPGMTNGLITVVTTVTTNTCAGNVGTGFYCTDPSGISSITTNSVQANLLFEDCECGG